MDEVTHLKQYECHQSKTDFVYYFHSHLRFVKILIEFNVSRHVVQLINKKFMGDNSNIFLSITK